MPSFWPQVCSAMLWWHLGLGFAGSGVFCSLVSAGSLHRYPAYETCLAGHCLQSARPQGFIPEALPAHGSFAANCITLWAFTSTGKLLSQAPHLPSECESVYVPHPHENNTEQSLTFKNAMIFCHRYENLSAPYLIFWCIEYQNKCY